MLLGEQARNLFSAAVQGLWAEGLTAFWPLDCNCSFLLGLTGRFLAMGMVSLRDLSQ